MQQKKALERPETGVFYLVPNPKSRKYTIYAEVDSPDNDAAHLLLWESIVELLRRRFRNKQVDVLQDNYRGLPRGRVMELSGSWAIGYGKDFPLAEYKHEILAEFKLYDYEAIGKVMWEFQDHETMQAGDKKAVESTLGIIMTPTGFTVRS